MIEKLSRTTPRELQVWMLSALVFGVGLGLLLAPSLARFGAWIFLIGAIVHGGTMYRIYTKK